MQLEAGAEKAHGPFVPLTRLASVGAVGFAGAGEVVAGRVVAAADQLDLGERVEHGAGRFVKLNRAANVERAMQCVRSARQIAEPDADLAECPQRHGESVTRPVRLVQRHASLGQRERLLVAVLEHHDVCLIAAHRRHHVVGPDQRGQTLRVAQRRHRLFGAAELRQRDAGEGMDERQVAPIAGGVQGGCRLADVLANDRHLADLPIALTELIVGQPDGARVVRQLGLLERAAVERDGPGLIAARRREAPVQPPEGRQAPGRDRLAQGVRSTSEYRRGLIEIVLQQRRFGQHAADGEFLVARELR